MVKSKGLPAGVAVGDVGKATQLPENVYGNHMSATWYNIAKTML